MKTARSHHPARALNADADKRVRGRLHRRAGSRRLRKADAAALAPARPLSWLPVRHSSHENLPFKPSAFVFDVEGTLIDCVMQTLQCWSETLGDFGFATTMADLHRYSGMDGRHMLRLLTRKHDAKLIDHLVALQGERYRANYLGHVRAFPGIRRLFATIKSQNGKIALASSCSRDEMAHYLTLLQADDLIDCACCGDDVRREKPQPDIVSLAAGKLRRPHVEIVMVGDTPYDAEAAKGAGLTAIGVQTGHFSRSDLMDAGCACVFFDLQALGHRLQDKPAAETAEEVAV
jgi:phosphoglycolate phosphatase-like HAD superfamily hydrolase